ncbi:oxidoreductase [Sporosarcina sp. NCCP-2716]|nr:oxidoreductase [Sporosarcina sp. NCCP-2716]
MADTDKHKKEPHQTDHSRRNFLKNSGMVAGGVVGGSLLGGLFMRERDEKHKTKPSGTKHETSFQEARIFFTREEDFKALEAATERIYPKDKNGPGAIELGVPFFIDKQLAGDWGINARDYRKGPFKAYDYNDPAQVKSDDAAEPHPRGGQGQGKESTDSIMRDQSLLNRREIFIEGVRTLNDASQKQHKTTYDQLEKDQQIDILKTFENGEVEMKSVPSQAFFSLLRQATIEGAYADPLYGGNKDMEGWKMKEFPGAYPSYLGKIDKDEFFKPQPVALKDSQQH